MNICKSGGCEILQQTTKQRPNTGVKEISVRPPNRAQKMWESDRKAKQTRESEVYESHESRESQRSRPRVLGADFPNRQILNQGGPSERCVNDLEGFSCAREGR